MGDYAIAKTEVSKFSDSVACLKVCFENTRGERIKEISFEFSPLHTGDSAKRIYEQIVQSETSLNDDEQIIALQMAAKISTKQTFSSESSSISKEIDESVFVTRPKQHRVIGEGKLIHESDSSDDGIPKKIKDCLAEKRKQTMSGEIPDVISSLGNNESQLIADYKGCKSDEKKSFNKSRSNSTSSTSDGQVREEESVPQKQKVASQPSDNETQRNSADTVTVREENNESTSSSSSSSSSKSSSSSEDGKIVEEQEVVEKVEEQNASSSTSSVKEENAENQLENQVVIEGNSEQEVEVNEQQPVERSVSTSSTEDAPVAENPESQKQDDAVSTSSTEEVQEPNDENKSTSTTNEEPSKAEEPTPANNNAETSSTSEAEKPNIETSVTSMIKEVDITSSKRVVELEQRTAIFVVRCENLVKTDLVGQPDCYFSMSFEETEIYCSSVIRNETNPVFDQVTIENIPFDIIIDFSFFDKDRLSSDDLIGKVSVSFADIKTYGAEHGYTILKGDKKRGTAFFNLLDDRPVQAENQEANEQVEEQEVQANAEKAGGVENVDSNEKPASSSSSEAGDQLDEEENNGEAPVAETHEEKAESTSTSEAAEVQESVQKSETPGSVVEEPIPEQEVNQNAENSSTSEEVEPEVQDQASTSSSEAVDQGNNDETANVEQNEVSNIAETSSTSEVVEPEVQDPASTSSSEAGDQDQNIDNDEKAESTSTSEAAEVEAPAQNSETSESVVEEPEQEVNGNAETSSTSEVVETPNVQDQASTSSSEAVDQGENNENAKSEQIKASTSTSVDEAEPETKPESADDKAASSTEHVVEEVTTSIPVPPRPITSSAVFVVRCEELKKMDLFGRPDCYFIISHEGNEIYKSSVIKDDKTPVFDEVTLENVPSDVKFDFTFMDWDKLSKDDLIGTVSVSLDEMRSNGPLHEYEIKKQGKDKVRGIAYFAMDTRVPDDSNTVAIQETEDVSQKDERPVSTSKSERNETSETEDDKVDEEFEIVEPETSSTEEEPARRESSSTSEVAQNNIQPVQEPAGNDESSSTSEVLEERNQDQNDANQEEPVEESLVEVEQEKQNAEQPETSSTAEIEDQRATKSETSSTKEQPVDEKSVKSDAETSSTDEEVPQQNDDNQEVQAETSTTDENQEPPVETEPVEEPAETPSQENQDEQVPDESSTSEAVNQAQSTSSTEEPIKEQEPNNVESSSSDAEQQVDDQPVEVAQEPPETSTTEEEQSKPEEQAGESSSTSEVAGEGPVDVERVVDEDQEPAETSSTEEEQQKPLEKSDESSSTSEIVEENQIEENIAKVVEEEQVQEPAETSSTEAPVVENEPEARAETSTTEEAPVPRNASSSSSSSSSTSCDEQVTKITTVIPSDDGPSGTYTKTTVTEINKTTTTETVTKRRYKIIRHSDGTTTKELIEETDLGTNTNTDTDTKTTVTITGDKPEDAKTTEERVTYRERKESTSSTSVSDEREQVPTQVVTVTDDDKKEVEITKSSTSTGAYTDEERKRLEAEANGIVKNAIKNVTEKTKTSSSTSNVSKKSTSTSKQFSDKLKHFQKQADSDTPKIPSESTSDFQKRVAFTKTKDTLPDQDIRYKIRCENIQNDGAKVSYRVLKSGEEIYKSNVVEGSNPEFEQATVKAAVNDDLTFIFDDANSEENFGNFTISFEEVIHRGPHEQYRIRNKLGEPQGHALFSDYGVVEIESAAAEDKKSVSSSTSEKPASTSTSVEEQAKSPSIKAASTSSTAEEPKDVETSSTEAPVQEEQIDENHEKTESEKFVEKETSETAEEVVVVSPEKDASSSTSEVKIPEAESTSSDKKESTSTTHYTVKSDVDKKPESTSSSIYKGVSSTTKDAENVEKKEENFQEKVASRSSSSSSSSSSSTSSTSISVSEQPKFEAQAGPPNVGKGFRIRTSAEVVNEVSESKCLFYTISSTNLMKRMYVSESVTCAEGKKSSAQFNFVSVNEVADNDSLKFIVYSYDKKSKKSQKIGQTIVPFSQIESDKVFHLGQTDNFVTFKAMTHEEYEEWITKTTTVEHEQTITKQVELIKPEEPKPEETTQVNNETSATITAKDCLHITVRAEELPKMDTVGRIDPYFRIDYEGRKVYRSPVIKDDPTPVWPRITILKSHFTKKMKFTVKDYDRFKKNEYVGEVTVTLDEIQRNGPLYEYKLKKKTGIKGRSKGFLTFVVEVPPASIAGETIILSKPKSKGLGFFGRRKKKAGSRTEGSETSIMTCITGGKRSPPPSISERSETKREVFSSSSDQLKIVQYNANYRNKQIKSSQSGDLDLRGTTGTLFKVRCEELPKMDTIRRVDCYFKMKLKAQNKVIYTSPIVKDDPSPVFPLLQIYEGEIGDNEVLEFEFWDHDVITKDEFIGTVEVTMSDLLNNGPMKEYSIELPDKQGKKYRGVCSFATGTNLV